MSNIPKSGGNVPKEGGPAWLRNLKPGDTVWFVPGDRRNIAHMGPLTVAKVGREYVTTQHKHCASRAGDRFRLDNGCSGPGQWPDGRIYPDRDAYERERLRQVEWEGMRRELASLYSPPDGVTAEDIIKARELLGVPA